MSKNNLKITIYGLPHTSLELKGHWICDSPLFQEIEIVMKLLGLRPTGKYSSKVMYTSIFKLKV